MKILILSDIHANWAALAAISESYDELWVLGDVVNCGPEPCEVTDFIMTRAALVVQGNHDHAVAHDDDSRWGGPYGHLAAASRVVTANQLNSSHKGWLRALPVQMQVQRQGTRFHLVHATPSDPLYGFLLPDSDGWHAELEGIDADAILVGHSHVQFIRNVGGKVIVNPGSVGLSGGSRACYAVWEDGHFLLRNVEYPVELTIERLRTVGLPGVIEQEIVSLLCN